jgi:hypothetical protein
METVDLREIDNWLRSTKTGEAVLHEPAVSTCGEVTEWANPQDRADALFLTAFSQLISSFGEPDSPALCSTDWRRELQASPSLQAVWDFDYYRVSLRVATQGKNGSVVVLAKEIS